MRLNICLNDFCIGELFSLVRLGLMDSLCSFSNLKDSNGIWIMLRCSLVIVGLNMMVMGPAVLLITINLIVYSLLIMGVFCLLNQSCLFCYHFSLVTLYYPIFYSIIYYHLSYVMLFKLIFKYFYLLSDFYLFIV